LVPNVEVCDVLLHRSSMNFVYKLYVMQMMKKLRIRPNSSVIERLERDIQQAQKMIVRKVNFQYCSAAIHTYTHGSCSAPFTIKTRPTVHFSVSTEVKQLIKKIMLIKSKVEQMCL